MDIIHFDESEKEEELGFFDLSKQTTCKHPQHEPPSHLYIPLGKGYRHKCPNCSRVSTLIPPQVTY